MATAVTYNPENDRYLDIGAPPPERAIFSTGEKVAMVAIPLFTLLLAALAITGACGGFQKAFAIGSGVLTGVQLLALPGTIRHYNREKEMERKEQEAFISNYKEVK